MQRHCAVVVKLTIGLSEEVTYCRAPGCQKLTAPFKNLLLS